MPPDPRVHVGTSAWVESDEGILVMMRAGTEGTAKDGYGKIAIPGGWLDFGEDITEAAVRETLEETGVVVEPVAILSPNTFISDDGSFQVVNLTVQCRYVSGTPTNMEPEKCPAVWWASWEMMHKFRAAGDLFKPLEMLMDREFSDQS